MATRRCSGAPGWPHFPFAVLGGTAPVTVRIGERIAVEKGAAANAAFGLTASPASWAEFAKPVPAVGFQSLVGMQRVGHLRVEGDILAWGRHMLFLEQVFAALRPPAPVQHPAAIGAAVIEPVVGRYLRLDFNGRPHRIYFEEAGQGIPLALPAHRRRRRPAISRIAERSGHHRALSCHRLRPAVAWQVFAARRLRDRGLPAHHPALRRHRDGRVARARPGAAGGDGLLDRRPRRAASGAAPRRAFPRRHRLAVGDACRARRRHAPARSRRAVQARHPWPGGGGRNGRLPDRAHVAQRPTSGKRCGTTCRAARRSSWATCTTISATAISGMPISPASTASARCTC